MALIVVIENERDLLELLEYHLMKEGYDVFASISTQAVERLLKEEMPDLMIVDRNLSGEEGSEFVAKLRSEGIDVPVVFLTAKASQRDIEEGFERGADDYVTKPFNFRELMHRIRAILRRSRPEESETIRYRDITIKPTRHEVAIENRKIDLTRLEYNLLMELIKNKSRVMSREELFDRVWGGEGAYKGKTVNVAINRLKEKIDPDKSKHYIRSVRGVGYQMC
ncbi:response regulator transcription factor [Hydrogenimonas urashimensis]|uniref:response regulator transcription factor n=1 Tax=Hydrogenimonas urashimensis TaxID=2740515 RepID=UPI003211AAC5